MTRQKAKSMLPIIEAFANDKSVQHDGGEGDWCDTTDLDLSASSFYYRIKPEPKLREWKQNEIPFNAIYCAKENRVVYYPLSQNNHSVSFCGCEEPFIFTYELKELFEQFEHSTNSGKTWLPCGVPE